MTWHDLDPAQKRTVIAATLVIVILGIGLCYLLGGVVT